jgi:predicted permease
VSAFPNTGNYGVPLSEFAFGATGRSTAVLFLSTQGVLIYTIGVYVAARGGGSGGLAGAKRAFKIPLVYAVVAALAVRWLGLVPPVDSALMQTLKLVGDSSIPVMLLILGIQLSSVERGASPKRVGLANALKMGVAPFVGVGVALALGFENSTVARVFVLECSMPAAITPLILVTEFGGSARIGEMAVPEFVSTVVMTTTLASVPLLTLLIAFLQSGLLF